MELEVAGMDVEVAKRQLNKLLDARAAGKNAQKEQNLLEQVWRRTERAVRERERRENRRGTSTTLYPRKHLRGHL